MTHFQLFARLGAAGLCATIAAALLAGCESMTTSIGKKIDYKSASSSPALEIPPDLSSPAYVVRGRRGARRRQDHRASAAQHRGASGARRLRALARREDVA